MPRKIDSNNTNTKHPDSPIIVNTMMEEGALMRLKTSRTLTDDRRRASNNENETHNFSLSRYKANESNL